MFDQIDWTVTGLIIAIMIVVIIATGIIIMLLLKKKQSPNKVDLNNVNSLDQLNTLKDIEIARQSLQSEADNLRNLRESQIKSKADLSAQEQQLFQQRELLLTEQSKLEQIKIEIATKEKELENKRIEIDLLEQSKLEKVKIETSAKEKELENKRVEIELFEQTTKTQIEQRNQALKDLEDKANIDRLQINNDLQDISRRKSELEQAEKINQENANRLEVDREKLNMERLNIQDREAALATNIKTFNVYQAEFAKKIKDELDELNRLRIEVQKKNLLETQEVENNKNNSKKLLEEQKKQVENEVKLLYTNANEEITQMQKDTIDEINKLRQDAVNDADKLHQAAMDEANSIIKDAKTQVKKELNKLSVLKDDFEEVKQQEVSSLIDEKIDLRKVAEDIHREKKTLDNKLKSLKSNDKPVLSSIKEFLFGKSEIEKVLEKETNVQSIKKSTKSNKTKGRGNSKKKSYSVQKRKRNTSK